jgi:hypothetical protein
VQHKRRIGEIMNRRKQTEAKIARLREEVRIRTLE